MKPLFAVRLSPFAIRRSGLSRREGLEVAHYPEGTFLANSEWRMANGDQEKTMSDERRGLVSAGAGLLWRRRSLFWWIFGVNVVLGWMGTMPALHALKSALGHSLAGEQLVKGFSLDIWHELMRVPEVKIMRFTQPSGIFAGLFALFMLFASGGILEAYRQDRRLTAEEFFGACGAFFWRFVRLALLSIVPFAAVGFLFSALNKLSDFVSDKTINGRDGFLVLVAGGFLVLLLTLFVRLWFDIAKVRAVAQRERRMWRNLWKALGISRRELGTLVWMYFRISLVAWIALALGLVIWTKLPPTAYVGSFLLLEVALLVQLAARLSQMASAITWYQRHAEAVPADTADYTTAHPAEVLEAAPEASPLPVTDLPPADA